VGGKQQLVYAGNVAWGHICAYKALKVSDKAVNGLPVFVTDDTGINDVSRFVQKMAVLGERFKVKTSWWYIPHFLFFFLAFLLEVVVKVAYPYTKYRLRYSLRALASYTSSMLMYSTQSHFHRGGRGFPLCRFGENRVSPQLRRTGTREHKR